MKSSHIALGITLIIISLTVSLIFLKQSNLPTLFKAISMFLTMIATLFSTLYLLNNAIKSGDKKQ